MKMYFVQNRLRVAVISTILLIAPLASAQESASTGDESTEDQMRRARAMMISGIVLTSVGVIGELAGAGIMIGGTVSANNQPDDEPTMSPGIDYMYGGFVMGFSALPLAVGIPLWIVGSKRKARLQAMTISPKISFAMDSRRGNYMLSAVWNF